MMLSLIVVLGLSASYPDLRNHTTKHVDVRSYGITDERVVYFRTMALIIWIGRLGNLTIFGSNKGSSIKRRVVSKDRTSQWSYCILCGPNSHVVDTHGLGDPLLARLPTFSTSDFIIGHFFRAVPKKDIGNTRGIFADQIKDKNLPEYYQKLSILILQPKLI